MRVSRLSPALCVFMLAVSLLGGCNKGHSGGSEPVPATPNAARIEKDVAYGSHPYQKMDVYFPQGYTMATPVVFLIHGGGFIAGLKEEFSMQAETFRKEGFIVVNISHRLVDTTGLLSLPPQRRPSDIKISHELADVQSAVARYEAMAAEWGSGSGRMYMAGHSAGAILTLLYTQGDYNTDGHIRAGGAWAGLTDLSLPHDSLLDDLDPRWKELLWRATGHEMKTANNLAYMYYSPYWQAVNHAGNPTITVWPQNNSILNVPGEVEYGLQNTRAFHTLLRDKGKAEKLSIYMGSDHGFGTPAGSWEKLIGETAAFFRER